LADDALIDGQVADWSASRTALLGALASAGFAALPNAATWFSCIDLGQSGFALDDQTFATRAVAEAGVATIPLSALWEGPPAPRHIVRLCHCKPVAMVEEAVERLARWREGLG
jgi:aspartate/methionine/tyrosine aminotransferase